MHTLSVLQLVVSDSPKLWIVSQFFYVWLICLWLMPIVSRILYMYMDDKHLIENILMGLVLFYRPSLPVLTKRVKRNQVVCKAYCFSLTILVILINNNVPLTIIRKTWLSFLLISSVCPFLSRDKRKTLSPWDLKSGHDLNKQTL